MGCWVSPMAPCKLKPKWARDAAGQHVCGLLNTKPNLRALPWGWEGSWGPGQRCRVPEKQSLHLTQAVGTRDERGWPGMHRKCHRISCFPSPFCRALK